MGAGTPTRTIPVDGMPMRVWAAGLAERAAGQPVVVLEAGAGNGFDTWTPVFEEIDRLTPVVAPARRGIADSAPDPVRPILPRQVEPLDAPLQPRVRWARTCWWDIRSAASSSEATQDARQRPSFSGEWVLDLVYSRLHEDYSVLEWGVVYS